MTAPNAAIDIINLAMDHCGEEVVSSIDAPVIDPEKLGARWYDQARRSLLRQYVWNFAKKRKRITRSTAAPDFDFEDAYPLPVDFLRFLSVGGYDEISQDLDYDIEGRELLLNNSGANSVKLRYIRDVTDVALFDPLFIDILSLTLALRFAYYFSLKEKRLQSISKLLSEELPKAVTIDGQERPPRRVQRSVWRTKRLFGGGHAGYATPYTVTD